MTKPNIEDIFAAFQEFQNDQRHGISSIREPDTWQKKMDEARAKLQNKLKALGLAEHIDWADRSNSNKTHKVKKTRKPVKASGSKG